jgi:hypothetical protein
MAWYSSSSLTTASCPFSAAYESGVRPQLVTQPISQIASYLGVEFRISPPHLIRNCHISENMLVVHRLYPISSLTRCSRYTGQFGIRLEPDSMYEESRGLNGYRNEYRKEVYHHREEVGKSFSESLMVGREMGARLRVGCHTLIAVQVQFLGRWDFIRCNRTSSFN